MPTNAKPDRSNQHQRRILEKSSLSPHKREEGEGLPKLEGYAALFNSITDLGWFTEEIAPGAFAESLERKDDVVALIDHRSELIVARTPDTLELREDEKGLFCIIDPIDTTDGRDLVEKVRRNVITQMSFGFYIEKETYLAPDNKTREKGHFIIEKVRLFDVSAVTFPAYTETVLQVARSITQEDLEARIKRAISRTNFARAEKDFRDREIELLRL